MSNINVNSGVTYTSRFFSSGDILYVSSGGMVNSCTVSGGGLVVLFSGKVNNTTVSGGYMHVSSGGTASNTHATAGCRLYVSSGGIATVTQVSNVGSLTILPGGLANSICVLPHANLIIDGGIANNAVISGGSMFVSSGGTANNATLNGDYYAGYMFIASGGMVNNAIISRNNYLYVSSGATANGAIISGGNLYVSSGGIVDCTNVKTGYMYVSSGATATNIIWTPGEGELIVDGGAYATFMSKYSGVYYSGSNVESTASIRLTNSVRMYVMSDGVADNTYLQGSSLLQIWSGGKANNTTVGWRGSLFVFSGGTANDTEVTSGIVQVLFGGIANNTTINVGGSLTISCDGIAQNIMISGGYLSVSSGGTAKDASVSNGYMIVSSGATVDGITVNSNGNLYVSSGGTANNIIWTPWEGNVTIAEGAQVSFKNSYSGVYYVSSGNIISQDVAMDSVEVESSCKLFIMSDGTANNATVGSNGNLLVFSGGTVYGTTVGGGNLTVFSGGTAKDTTVSNGNLHISAGAIVDGITVESNGNLYVSSGGTALNIIWTPCEGNVTIAEGAQVSFKNSHSGVYYGLNGNLVSHEAVMNSIIVSSSYKMYVMSDGVANRTSVYWMGNMYVFSGGTANNTMVSNNGHLYVSSGGIANSTSVNSSYLNVSAGGTANDAMIGVSSYLYVSSGGTANRTSLSGGCLFVSSGGIANSVSINLNGDLYVLSGGVANNISAYGGYLRVSSGGTANNIRVSSVCFVSVFSGGTANNATVNSGFLYVLSGGIATLTTVNSSGCLVISSGGTASVVFNPWQGAVHSSNGAAVTFLERDANIYYGGGGIGVISKADVTDSLKVSSGYSAIIYSGGEANNTTIFSGNLFVSAGGIADNTNVNTNSYLYVYADGMADNTTINGYGYLYVYGTANNTTLLTSTTYTGYLNVCSGGTANSTTISRGFLNVSSGGVADSTTIYGGTCTVSAGGMADHTTVIGGTLTVIANGTADNTVLKAGGLVVSSRGITKNASIYNNGALTVSSGGTAVDTAVNSGNFNVSSGGTADNTAVSGGNLNISSGGAANNVTIYTSGAIHVSSGGTASIAFNPWNRNIDSKYGATITYLERDKKIYYGGANTGLISKADIIDSLAVISGNSLIIYSGGTATETAENGGYVDINDGANVTFVANTFSNLVLSSASATVHSGTTANRTRVNNGGYFHVFFSGTGTEIIENGGYVDIDDGANVTFVANTFSNLVLSSASATVHSGTTAKSTTVNSSGYLTVFSGGVANSTIVNSSGYLYVSSGGTAYNTTIDGASSYYSSQSHGYLHVFSGGVANSTFINSRGEMYVSGGAAYNTIISAGANLTIFSGGTADYTLIGNGYLIVSFGAVANHTTLSSGGSLQVSSGGIVNNTTINGYSSYNTYYGGLYISSGGVANNATVKSGVIYVSSSGIANSITLNPYGKLNISSGGTATDIIENGGCVSVEDGARATFVTNTFSNLVLSSASATVHSGTTANDTTINDSGNLTVYFGGVANNTIANSKSILLVSYSGTANSTVVNTGGTFYISSGAVANKTVVSSGGTFHVSSGGEANSTTVNTGVNIYIQDNGTANNTILNGGMYVSSRAIANGTVVNSSGNMYVSAGGIANSTTIYVSGNLYVSSGATASNTTVSNGRFNVFAGGKANLTAVNGGTMVVSSGGTANNITIYTSGILYVSSGGTATIAFNPWSRNIYSSSGANITYLGRDQKIYFGGSNTGLISKADIIDSLTIISGNSLIVYSGGTARGIIENGGYVDVEVGAQVSFAANTFSNLVLSYTSTTVHSGTTANSTTISNGGNLFIYSGGTANDTTVNYSATMFVYNGATANRTTINTNGSLTICSKGNANNNTISGGNLYVSSGGTANSTTAMGGSSRYGSISGFLHVFSGGTANNSFIDSYGYLYVYGMAKDTIVNAGGSFCVFSGGTANDTIMSGGILAVSFGGMANKTTINGGNLAVSSGGTANITTMSGGNLSVSSGGLVNSTVIDSGYLTVSSGGTANSTTMYGGNLNVSFGGVANSITIYTSGYLRVFSGGTASLAFNPWSRNVNLASGAVITHLERDKKIYYGGSNTGLISKADVIDSLTVISGNSLIVYSGGTARGIIENGGYVDIDDGAKVSFIANTFSNLVLSNASANVHSGTTANSTTVNNGGKLYVSSGGITISTTVNSGGSMLVSSGGKANNITINSGGYLYVLPNGFADEITVNTSGYLYVSAGGTATIVFNPWQGVVSSAEGATITYLERDANVYYGGKSGLIKKANALDSLSVIGDSVIVYSGGVASKIIVSRSGSYNYGYLHVSSGGIASDTTINGGGYLNVSSGGTANDTVINTGGYLVVLSGGLASNTTINSGGYLYVSSGGTANRTAVSSACHLTVSSGGMVNNTVVNAYGTLTVSSGGTAMTIMENGGYVNIWDEANVTFASNSFSNLVLSNTSTTVHSGTTANSTTLNYGAYLYVSSGGVTNNTSINSGGCLRVLSGGTATGVIWTPFNGYIQIENGAQVTFANHPKGVFYGYGTTLLSSAMILENITLQGNTSIYAMDSGLANSTIVSSGGSLLVSSGGTSYNANVLARGVMSVTSGGSAAHIMADSGALLDFIVAPNTYIEGAYVDSAFEIKNGSAMLYTINPGTILHVASGGIANRTYMYQSGCLYVSAGGKASQTTMSGGIAYVSSGGVLDNTVISAGGSLYVSFGATANSTTINSRGSMGVSSGGIATNITANNGATCLVYLGGSARAIMVNNGGCLAVYSGGTASDIVASSTRLCLTVAPNTYAFGTSGGMSFETKNGAISNYSVNAGGWLNVISGGTAKSTTINNSGSVFISNGGETSWTTINFGGRMYVSNGGAANYTTMNGGYLTASSGGIINQTINSNGSIFVSSSGLANDTTLNAGGRMSLVSGGVASNVTINSNGYLSIENSKLTGKITIADGGIVHAGPGAVVDFDISHLAPGLGPRINNLSLIKDDSPAFTLSISDLQWNGVYTLAKGVGVFDNLISIKSLQNDIVHMVAVNETANVDGVEFTLKLVDSTLTITVTGGRDIPIIPVSADVTALTNQDVTLTAGFSDNAIMREYSYDNETWYVYTEPVKCIENGTVYFLGKDQRGYVNEIASYEIKDIDKTPPKKPTASADISAPTNGSVTVTATFSEDSSIKEFSFDEQTWSAYTAPIVLDKNGSVFFRGIDEAGNVSVVTVYTVSNIDKTAPEKPIVSANIRTQTNQPVTVTATFSENTDKKEYSFDEQTWLPYSNGVKITNNSIVYFRGTDAAGNVSEIRSYEVTNIDTTAPDKPVAIADITSITNGDVFVTATFSEDSTNRQYSLNGQTWSAYTEAVRLSVNGTVYFRSIDEAGNISEVTSLVIDNIDKIAPDKPIATADITKPTRGAVLVSATFSNDSITQEYSFDGQTWQAYTTVIEFIKNGSVSFRGTDEAGNVSVVETYTVSNIDTTAPDKPGVSADITKDTNTDVTVSAVFSEDSVVKEYSLDGKIWMPYTDGVAVSDNRTVSFRGTDEAGNVSEIATYTVTNIDRTAPEKPVASADITEITNTDVMVSAVFSDDSVRKEYSLDGTNWRTYTAPLPFSQNGVAYFRGADAAGNTSEPEIYTVSNIDKVAPDKPVATADIMTPTNGIVRVSAIFNDKSVSKEYSMNGTDWKDYTGSVEFTTNGVVFFRSTDAIGNVSEITTYEVNNIDTIAPEKPTVSADITTATVQDVTVTAVFSNDSVVREYTLDGQTWKPYTEPITFAANGSVSFRGKDEAGNVSEEADYVVNNIHKALTGKPVASADITTPTNQTVTVNAVFDADSVKNEYSINGLVWLTYVDGVRMLDNGVVYFRSTNALGNVSEIEAYTVDYIDKVAPDKPFIFSSNTKLTNQDVTVTAVYSEDSTVKEYSTDGQTWLPYTEPLKVSENGMFLFRAKDAAGNNSGMVNFEVGNIDKNAPVITLSGDTKTPAEQVTLMATVDDGSALFYRIGNSDWAVYTGAITVSSNATYSFKATDVVGNTGTAEIIFRNIKSATVVMLENLVGTPEKVSWGATGAEQYIVEFSTDNFEHVIQMVTSASATDLLDLPVGTYKWRVKADDDNSEWAVGETIVSGAEDDSPKIVQSNEDGNDDLFFATANGTWENIYYAQNVGSVNDWTGTNEIISANGRGRIQNLFFGSSDPNVLCLTDGENGDAIFVDDVYTDSLEDIARETSRLYKIQEIRAGIGDDIVDMTSQRFEYVGGGLTIRGGDGNDTIWANKGNNLLFGDDGNDRIVGASGNDVIAGGTGNDRMHGGGGEDIFTFCDNWGEDTVEQLAGGKVTLWFASGSKSNWNEEELTYTDGDNSVTVKGVASVTLKFGNDGSDKYDELVSVGGFAEFTSQKIFEESKGVLA